MTNLHLISGWILHTKLLQPNSTSYLAHYKRVRHRPRNTPSRLRDNAETSRGLVMPTSEPNVDGGVTEGIVHPQKPSVCFLVMKKKTQRKANLPSLSPSCFYLSFQTNGRIVGRGSILLPTPLPDALLHSILVQYQLLLVQFMATTLVT